MSFFEAALFLENGHLFEGKGFGSEISNPRTMQKGIVFGILIVLFLYLAINYTYVKVIGFDLNAKKSWNNRIF